jgi:hypothetical protein
LELTGEAQQGEGDTAMIMTHGLLTRAWAAVWRSGDGGEEQRWLELITRVKEGTKGLGRGEKVW